MIISLFAIPGRAGGAEYTLSVLFASFIHSNTKLVLAMILWRLLTYYFGMFALFAIPGRAGGAEYTLSVLFASFIHSNTKLVLAMILWRLLTYYFGMFAGIVAVFIKPDKVKR